MKIKTDVMMIQMQVEENIGMVSIFTIAEAVKEWLNDHNVPEKTMHEEMMERAKAAENEVTEKAEVFLRIVCASCRSPHMPRIVLDSSGGCTSPLGAKTRRSRPQVSRSTRNNSHKGVLRQLVCTFYG